MARFPSESHLRLPHDRFLAGRHREWIMVLAGERIASVRTYDAFLKAVREGTHGLEPRIARVRAIYLISELDGSLRAACCFTIGFDPEGRVPPGFDLPLRELALKSGDGPDLGAGLVRIAHRRKCAVHWHAERLWGERDADVRPVLDAAQRLLCDRLQGRAAGAPEAGPRDADLRDGAAHPRKTDAHSVDLRETDPRETALDAATMDRRTPTPGRRASDRPNVVDLAERKADRAFGEDNTLSPAQLQRGRRLAAEDASGPMWTEQQVEALRARHRNEIGVLKSEIELLRRRLRAAECDDR